MAGNTAILAVRVVADASDATRGLEQTSNAARRFEGTMRVANRGATAAIAGLALLGKTAFDAASNQEQAFGAVESVYGKAADRVTELANAAADTVGLAASEYAQFAAVLGSQLRNLGVAEDELIGTQDQLIRTAADMAAMFGGTTAEAVEALSALFRGETDPIERYGVSIKQADVNARLAAQGLDDLEGSARTQAETAARLALVSEQTAAAQGQFAREADSAAGAQQRATAAWQNASATLGQALLPIVAQVSGIIVQLSGFIQDHTTLVTGAATAIGVLAVSFKVLNAVMRANPIALVISLVATLITMVITAYRESETFRRIVDAAGRGAVAAFKAIWGPVSAVIDIVGRLIGWIRRQDDAFGTARRIATAAISAIITPIRDVIDWVGNLVGKISSNSTLASAFRTIGSIAEGVWNGIQTAIETVAGAISSVIGAIESAQAKVSQLRGSMAGLSALPGPLGGLGSLFSSARAPLAPSLSSGSARRGPAVVNVHVSGALDPDNVARQITNMLTARGLRTGELVGFVS